MFLSFFEAFNIFPYQDEEQKGWKT